MVGLVHSPIYAMLPNVRLNVMECADAAEFSWCRMLVGICSSYNAAQRYNAATIASLSHTVEVMQTLQLLQLATMLRLATAVWCTEAAFHHSVLFTMWFLTVNQRGATTAPRRPHNSVGQGSPFHVEKWHRSVHIHWQVLHEVILNLTSCRPPRYAAAPLLPLWAPKRLAPPSTPQHSSSFPRPRRSHAHRCSCLTR